MILAISLLIVGMVLFGSLGLAILGFFVWFIRAWKAWLVIALLILVFYH